MMDMLIKFQDIQEKVHSQKDVLKIVAGVDETFFEQMKLVLIDLSSGYILLEEISEDRTYDTWMEKVRTITERLKLDVKYFVSDRAKALIKLAVKGNKCLSIPDLFHASNEIVKLFGLSLNRKKEGIQKKIAKVTAELALLKEMSKNVRSQEITIEQLNNELTLIESGISSYRNTLHDLSKIVHPFNIDNGNKQTTAVTYMLLVKIVEDVGMLKIEYGINDNKNRVTKFENQIEEIASLIDAWWLWAEESLDNENINKEHKRWLLYQLLPVVYWQCQVSKTKNPLLRQCYQTAFKKAQTALYQHRLSSSLICDKKWMSWAEWMVSNFQRTSSAVEGRNGCLSQLHHAGRGLNSNRLKALTVIHNYYLKRSDGTTASERFFKRKIPDPFEWLVEHMGDLPLPRRPRHSMEVTC